MRERTCIIDELCDDDDLFNGVRDCYNSKGQSGYVEVKDLLMK